MTFKEMIKEAKKYWKDSLAADQRSYNYGRLDQTKACEKMVRDTMKKTIKMKLDGIYFYSVEDLKKEIFGDDGQDGLGNKTFDSSHPDTVQGDEK